MKKCLIYLEHTRIKSGIQLLEVAARIFQSEPYEVYGIEFFTESEEAKGYFDEMIRVWNGEPNAYDIRYQAHVMSDIQDQFEFDCIIIPGTPGGRMLAPRLAARLHTGLTADVVEVRNTEQGIEMIRPAFGGRIMAGIRNTGNGPVMMSVRENVFSYQGYPDKNTRITSYQEYTESNGLKMISYQEKKEAVDICDSQILIAGGEGIAGNFEELRELADLLEGNVAASRKIIDRGLAPRSIQVGQSGKTVSPRLYMAFGIHGSMQHIEGIRDAECLISININRKAPICSISDIVVEGDAQLFLKMLIEKIKKEQED